MHYFTSVVYPLYTRFVICFIKLTYSLPCCSRIADHFVLPKFQSESYNFNNPTNITAEEYFNPNVDLQGRDIGRPKEVVKKVQNFKVSKC